MSSALVEGPSVSASDWPAISDFLSFWLKSNPLTGPERAVFDRYYGGYRRRFGPYLRHHFAEQTREVTAMVRARPGLRLLEVGAGCGTESLWFALQGADVTAIDLATDRLAVARARRDWLQARVAKPLRAEFVEQSLFGFEPARPFEVIWMEQTFHHIEPREEVFPKLFSLLSPGGTLVISESNAWNLPMQLQLFMRRGFKTKTFTVDPAGRKVPYGNERITTPQALANGLRGAGFRIEGIKAFRLLPNIDVAESWIPKERALLAAMPWLSTHFNVTAVKPAA